MRNRYDHELGSTRELAHRPHAPTDRPTAESYWERRAQRYVQTSRSAPVDVLLRDVPGVEPARNRSELFAGPAPDNGETAAEQGADEELLSAKL